MSKGSTAVISNSGIKEKFISFSWQHLWLVVSLFVMTLGVAICVRSGLGSSVISTIPYVMTMAGRENPGVPSLTIGEYTYLMNFLLVGLQIAVLRKRFEPVQLFQLLIGFFFGFLLDVNMYLTSGMQGGGLTLQVVYQVLGCAILAFGIAMEVKCGSVTMPGEGFPVALTQVTTLPFAKAKIIVDISLVVIAVALGYIFTGSWLWQVVGPGTLFAMISVGLGVKFFSPRLGWFDRLLSYRPGFRRHIYGLLKKLH